MTVYFLRPKDMSQAPVKIGCSRIPADRLATYMPWSPYELEIAAELVGDYRLEMRLHAHFQEQRIHHEWYRWSPALERVIQDARAGTFDPTFLPDHGPKRLPRGSPWSRAAGGLNISLSAKSSAIGIRAPKHIEEASRDLARLTGAERDAAAALIRAFVADPLVEGLPMEWPLPRLRLAAYLAKRGVRCWQGVWAAGVTPEAEAA